MMLVRTLGASGAPRLGRSQDGVSIAKNRSVSSASDTFGTPAPARAEKARGPSLQALFAGPAGGFAVEPYRASVASVSSCADEKALTRLLSAYYGHLGLAVEEAASSAGRTLTVTIPGSGSAAPIVLCGAHAFDQLSPVGARALLARGVPSSPGTDAARATAALMQAARVYKTAFDEGVVPARTIQIVHTLGDATSKLAALRLEGAEGGPAFVIPDAETRAILERTALELGLEITSSDAERVALQDHKPRRYRPRPIIELSRDERSARLATETIGRVAGLPQNAGGLLEPEGFYRVLYGRTPSPRDRELLEYLYGAPLVFDERGTGPDAQASKTPILLRGTVVHTDPVEDPEVFLGDVNPTVNAHEKYSRYGDKWEEHLLLKKHAPAMCPVTLRGDTMIEELGIDPALRTADPRGFLVAVQNGLNERYGKYILKARNSYGTDGHLPTHKTDFGGLWDAFQTHFVPERETLKQTITDRDQLNARLYETVRYAEGQSLEALVSDPATIIVQPFIAHRDELRAHVVEGRVVEGATVQRTGYFGRWTDLKDVERLETALREMLKGMEPISCTLDALVTADGFKIVDLNAGIESGMYHPDSDIAITNLLAEHFTGRQTPFLRDLRAFERAPLSKKLELGFAIEAMIGGYARKNEADGFYDRVVSAYMAEVVADPRAETLMKSWRQVTQFEGVDAWALYRFLEEPTIVKVVSKLDSKDRQRILRDLNASDDGSVSAMKKNAEPGTLPFVRGAETDYSDDEVVRWICRRVTELAGPHRIATKADIERALEKWVTTPHQFQTDPKPETLYDASLAKFDPASGQQLFSLTSASELVATCALRLAPKSPLHAAVS